MAYAIRKEKTWTVSHTYYGRPKKGSSWAQGKNWVAWFYGLNRNGDPLWSPLPRNIPKSKRREVLRRKVTCWETKAEAEEMLAVLFERQHLSEDAIHTDSYMIVEI